jgi:hypothetical protein
MGDSIFKTLGKINLPLSKRKVSLSRRLGATIGDFRDCNRGISWFSCLRSFTASARRKSHIVNFETTTPLSG